MTDIEKFPDDFKLYERYSVDCAHCGALLDFEPSILMEGFRMNVGSAMCPKCLRTIDLRINMETNTGYSVKFIPKKENLNP